MQQGTFHVLLVAPNFGTYGGCEAFMFRLADELHRNGITVTMCFKRVNSQFQLDEKLQSFIDATPIPVHFVDRASRDLWEQIASADIVHGQNTSIDIAVFAKLARKPLVLTIHGWLRTPWNIRGILARIAAGLSDRRWYNSDFVWDKWEPGVKRSTSGKLPIISNLPEGVVSPRDRSGFIFASRWIENKGLEVLLKAYARADLDRDKWPLTILGDGPLRPQIERLIHDLGLENVVRDKGFVNDEERNAIFRHSKWMVTPPHTHEDLGLTPIEARHVGVPCIITRDGGLPEAGGRFALKCEPNNVDDLREQLEKAAAMDDEEYEQLAMRTRKELLDYLQPMSVYIEEYQSILRQKKLPHESDTHISVDESF